MGKRNDVETLILLQRQIESEIPALMQIHFLNGSQTDSQVTGVAAR